ncbi:MAG: glutaredoxin family protein [Legionellales bacterium]|nr:glutaredoxin family protein [Legionellales bacterium]
MKTVIFIFSCLILMLSAGCASQSVYLPSAVNAANQHLAPVKIYGAPSCVNTMLTKIYFQEHGIPYHYYSVVSSVEGINFYNKVGAPGIPIIVVGKQQILGYNTDPINKALRKAGYVIS